MSNIRIFLKNLQIKNIFLHKLESALIDNSDFKINSK